MSVTAALTGLAPDTTYYDGWSRPAPAARPTARSSASPPRSTRPLATTQPATGITPTRPRSTPASTPRGGDDVSFVYGTSSTLTTGTTTTVNLSIGNGTDSVRSTQPLTGLAPGTTYYYEAIATNAGGTIDGSILSFTTTDRPARLDVQAATAVAATTATLNCQRQPRGQCDDGLVRLWHQPDD